MFKNAAKLAAKVGVTNCLQLEVGPRDECQCPPNCPVHCPRQLSARPLSIDIVTVARDPRVQAHVSYEEAVIYVRGVNARLANHRSCWYKPFLACFVIGAAVFGGMMGAFHELPRIRCKGRVCERGEDPLVDGCCIFWCCGDDIDGGKYHHELPARPYNTSWDVWSSEAYFGIDERCSLYDEEHKPEDHTKRDANYGCGSCPATLADEKGACKTMFEGNAKDYEVTWPLLFLIPYLLPIPFLIGLICACLGGRDLPYARRSREWEVRKKLGAELIRNVRGVGYMVPKA